MLASLNKYRAAFSVGLQSNLVYRVNFAIRGFFSFFHLIVVFILDRAVGLDRVIGQGMYGG